MRRHRGADGSPRSGLRGARQRHSLPLPGRTTQAALPPPVADYADGLTQVQIAEKHGIHVQTVRKRLIAAGVDTRIRLRALNDDEIRAARVATGEGASIREIARGLGVAHTTLARSLAHRHETPKSPSRTTKVGLRTSPASARARRSPLRTTSETRADQGKRQRQTGPGIEMPGPDLG